MLQTVPLIYLFLGREEALRNAFFTFCLHILGSLADVFGLCLVCLVLWVFFTVLLEVKCNFLKLTKRTFHGIFLSSSLPIQSPPTYNFRRSPVGYNEINEVLYLLAFYE